MGTRTPATRSALARPFQEVLAPYDFTEVSRQTLPKAIETARLRHAPCPVLVLRDPRRWVGFERLRRVVVAHDTSSHSQRALELAVDVATTFGLALDLVHVLPDPIYPAYYGGAATLELALQRERLATAARAELERRLAEARAGIATVPGTEPRSTQLPSTELPSSELHTPAGDPAQEIAEIAERTGAGLIVIATHGLSGLDRVPIGSVTERLVRIAQCAVLVVPAKSSAASEAGASDRDYA